MNGDISAALRFDPLAEAERLTGKSHKDDAATSSLGFGLALIHNQEKEALLRSTADSHFNMAFAETVALYADLGFDQVYREQFTGSGGAETYLILWHPEGILATCESYARMSSSLRSR